MVVVIGNLMQKEFIIVYKYHLSIHWLLCRVNCLEQESTFTPVHSYNILVITFILSFALDLGYRTRTGMGYNYNLIS